MKLNNFYCKKKMMKPNKLYQQLFLVTTTVHYFVVVLSKHCGVQYIAQTVLRFYVYNFINFVTSDTYTSHKANDSDRLRYL